MTVSSACSGDSGKDNLAVLILSISQKLRFEGTTAIETKNSLIVQVFLQEKESKSEIQEL